LPQHSQAHGGQVWSAAQAGQAHPQPPLAGLSWAHAPVGHGAVTQAMPTAIQRHVFIVSAMQVAASVKWAHGSAATSAGVGGTGTALWVTPTLPAPQAQSQAGQLVPAGHAGQAQVHVRAPLLAPVAPPQVAGTLLHEQLQGGQTSPGAHTGQAQVHVPAPPLLPGVGFEQSHWTVGQSALAGQTIGCTQVHPPPEASRVWQ
jgi:hypothetical protein